MVNSISMVCMGISAIICFLLPIIAFLYFKRKEKMNLRPAFIGMIVFFVFTQILEKSLHLFVTGNNFIHNPFLFSIYGALTAGIFEETGRFIAFKTVLKNKHEWKDGLSIYCNTITCINGCSCESLSKPTNNKHISCRKYYSRIFYKSNNISI